MKLTTALLIACAGAVAQTATAGVSILVADRNAHKIWRLTDVNNDGAIQSGEVFVWFDGTNAAGTPNISSIGTLAIRPSDNTVIAGDVALHEYFMFKDVNHANSALGDALGPNSSHVVLTTANASGASTASPQGAAFMPGGDVLIANAGNGSGPDAIYRCHAVDSVFGFDGPGEVTDWVTTGPSGFGPGNGPYSPAELVVDANNVGYLRNSGALNGVYKFSDTTNNGRADDTGEFMPWFNSSNQSGVTLSAGFSIEPDRARPGSMYFLQTATGSVDQIYRLTPDSGGTANGPGDAVLVYSTAEAVFTSQDLLCLPDGDLLMSDVTGKRIIRLHDGDGNGLFTVRTDFFLAGAGPVLDTRQMVLLTDHPNCGSADFNGDGDIGTDSDIEAFFACLAGTCCPLCGTADFNGDGDIGTDSDIEAFFRVLAGGAC